MAFFFLVFIDFFWLEFIPITSVLWFSWLCFVNSAIYAFCFLALGVVFAFHLSRFRMDLYLSVFSLFEFCFPVFFWVLLLFLALVPMRYFFHASMATVGLIPLPAIVSCVTPVLFIKLLLTFNLISVSKFSIFTFFLLKFDKFSSYIYNRWVILRLFTIFIAKTQKYH